MPKTHVSFLLDRSGSMQNILNDTIGGFNAYLDTLRETPDVVFSLTLFSSSIPGETIKLCERVVVSEAPRLTPDNFRPDGGTPLVDAFCDIIQRAMLAKKEGDKDKFQNIADEIGIGEDSEQVVITVLTDGEENSSSRFTSADLSEMIKAREAEGWQFNYLGASIDAYKQAQKFGISVSNTMSFNSFDASASMSNYAGLATRTAAYASGQRRDTKISREEKMAAGDIFDPDRMKVKPN